MVIYGSALDATFGALSDPVRRAVLARLAHGEAGVSELAAGHPISLPAFLKHLRVLEEAGLVASRKEGRVRRCRLMPDPLATAEEWLEQHRVFWSRQLDSLARYLTESNKEDEPK